MDTAVGGENNNYLGTYRVTKGTSYRMTGKKVVYKTIRHCQHKQKKPTKKMTQSARDIKFGAPKEGCERSTRDKKTGCPSTLSATVLARGSTLKYPQYPCFVKLSFNHNHPQPPTGLRTCSKFPSSIRSNQGCIHALV